MGRVVSSTSSISKRELASHNQWYNTGLAGFFNYLFYQEYKKGTHTLGGDSKLDRIAISSPGLRMIKVKRRSVIREHPMQRLLDDLYSLLHEHYAALDVATLAQYEVKSEKSMFPQKEPTTRAFDPGLFVSNSTESTRSAPVEPSASVTNTDLAAQRGLVKWQGETEPQLVLDDHEAMLQIFTAVLIDKSHGPLVFGDKTLDQLYVTLEVSNLRPTGCTGTAIKRKVEEDYDGPSPKRRKIGNTSTRSLGTLGLGEDEKEPHALLSPDNVGYAEKESDESVRCGNRL